ncbi:hypothetical protein [Amycolatopsis sp.]|uniref:hypothetical protein n=1 Tax=Amycolatopsis sp. TaxID=37632 RepID=UPI002C88EBD8|nr:hypothetical protein [Amycolatopsis sp.]HVV10416.1 hypothetical protein [Amycolatopsis sp.]
MIRGYRKWMVAAAGVAVLAVSSAAAGTTAGAVTPVAAPAQAVVPGCEQGCESVFSVALPGGSRLEGLQRGMSAYLAYWDGAALKDSTQVQGTDGFPYATVTGAVCASDRCTVSFGYGAHAGAVAAVQLGAKITVTDKVEGVTAEARDLNGDGEPDAIVRQSTYEPDFASAPLYWETYLSHNGHLVRTGCTAPGADTPAGAVAGGCPV